MNISTALIYLQCYKAGERNDPMIEKAYRAVTNDSRAREELRKQQEFDERFKAVVRAIETPEDLQERLSATVEKKRAGGTKWKVTFPAILAIGSALASLAAVLTVMHMESVAHFPGREAADRIMDTANRMSGIEFEPVSQPTAQLSDWFYMHGFDGFGVPAEFNALPAVGVQVMPLDGKPVAQVAVDRHDSLLYVFHASDFGIGIPADGEWLIFDHDGWAGGIERRGNLCTLITFRGKPREMKAFLHTLSP